MFLAKRNQFIDLKFRSVDWFLYDEIVVPGIRMFRLLTDFRLFPLLLYLYIPFLIIPLMLNVFVKNYSHKRIT